MTYFFIATSQAKAPAGKPTGNFVYNSLDERVGFHFRSNGIMFMDSVHGMFNFETGEFMSSISYEHPGDMIGRAGCMFESMDCTGTCLAGSVWGNTSSLYPNTLYTTNGIDFLLAHGTEADAGPKTIQSIWSKYSTCEAGNWPDVMGAFAVTTPYILPADLSPPLYWGR